MPNNSKVGLNFFSKLQSHSFFPVMVAFFVFSSFNPFYLWGFSFSTYLKALTDFLFILFWFFCIYKLKINRFFFFILPILLLWGFARFLPIADSSQLIPILTWAFKLFFLLMLPSMVIVESRKYFSFFLAFFGSFTIVNFIFIFLTGDAFSSYELINPYKGKELFEQNYIGYFFGSYLDYLKICSSGFCFARMNGAFDEPGLWGTVCALYLASCKLDLSSRSHKIIFLSGFLTFSLAFYLLLIIASLFINIRKGFIVVSIMTFFAFILYYISGSYFQEMIFNRFNIEHFLFQRGAEPLVELISQSDISNFIFGQGYLSSLLVAPGASSWVVHLYEGGLVLLFFMFIFYFLVFLAYDRKISFYYFPVIIFSFLQRPEIVWIGFVYLCLVAVTYRKVQHHI